MPPPMPLEALLIPENITVSDSDGIGGGTGCNFIYFFYHQEVADDVEGAIITKSEKEVFIEEKILSSRKHILDISSESITKRLSILLDHIHFIAKRESVDAKKIATLSLEILANREYDRKTTKVCK